MSDAMSAQGTYISKGTLTSPPTYTEIAEVVSIGGPNESSEEIDVTHLRSTGGYREFLQSFKDGGELPLELNFLPINPTQDGQTGLRADFQSGTVYPWKITYPDGSYLTFDGYVKAIANSAAVGQKLTFNVTIRVSGVVSLTEGEGSPL